MPKQSFEHHSLVPISCSIDLQRVLQVMEFIYPAKENKKENLKIPIIGLLQQSQSPSPYRKNTQNLIWNVKKTTQMFTSSYNTIKNPLNLPCIRSPERGTDRGDEICATKFCFTCWFWPQGRRDLASM